MMNIQASEITPYDLVRRHHKRELRLNLALFQYTAIKIILLILCIAGEAILTFIPISSHLNSSSPLLLMISVSLSSIFFVVAPSCLAHILKKNEKTESEKTKVNKVDRLVFILIFSLLVCYLLLLAAIQILPSFYPNQTSAITFGVQASDSSSASPVSISINLFFSILRVGVSAIAFLIEYYDGSEEQRRYHRKILEIDTEEMRNSYESEKGVRESYIPDPESPVIVYTEASYEAELASVDAAERSMQSQSRSELMEKLRTPEEISEVSYSSKGE